MAAWLRENGERTEELCDGPSHYGGHVGRLGRRCYHGRRVSFARNGRAERKGGCWKRVRRRAALSCSLECLGVGCNVPRLRASARDGACETAGRCTVRCDAGARVRRLEPVPGRGGHGAGIWYLVMFPRAPPCRLRRNTSRRLQKPPWPVAASAIAGMNALSRDAPEPRQRHGSIIRREGLPPA